MKKILLGGLIFPLLLAACSEPAPTPSDMITPSPSAVEISNSPTPTVTPEPTASEEPAEVQTGISECVNEDLRIKFDIPTNWWFSARPDVACLYLSPEEFSLALLGTNRLVEINLDVTDDEINLAGDLINSEQITIADAISTRWEYSVAFPYSLTYQYIIAHTAADGEPVNLVFTVSSTISGDDYVEHKQVLDSIITSLTFIEP